MSSLFAFVDMDALVKALSEHNFEKAEAEVTKLIKGDDTTDDLAILLLTRAVCRFRLHDVEACIGDATGSLQIIPTKVGYYLRALGYQAAGGKDRAIKDLEATSTRTQSIESPLWKFIQEIRIDEAEIQRTLRRLKQSKQADGPAFYAPGFKVPPKRLYRLNVFEVNARVHAKEIELCVRCCLVDEMSLYRDIDFKQHVSVQASSNGASLDLKPLPPHLGGIQGIHKGRGGFITTAPYDPKGYLDIQAMDVLSIRIGPLKRIVQAKAVDTFRVLDDVVCLEQWDASIPGKIWDSAVFLARLAKGVVTDGSHSLDLSTGTGFVGIYAASNRNVKMQLSDLDIALDLMRRNVDLNQSKARVVPLEWGNEKHIEDCLSNGPLDFIFASDVVYETAFLGALLDTLDQLSCAQTTVFLAYKQRGLSEEERDDFWSCLQKIYSKVERMSQDQLQKIDMRLSDAVDYGVEIWRAKK